MKRHNLKTILWDLEPNSYFGIKLNETGLLLGEHKGHKGGCLLFDRENEVKGLLSSI